MDYILANPWVMWLIVGVLCLIVELATVSLVSIWFVAAAVITAIISLFLDSYVWQIVIFLVLSGLFMALFRSTYLKRLKKGSDDDIKPENKLIGKSAVTVEDTGKDGGKVLVGDIYWRAVTEDESIIEKNNTVVITGVENTTLVIKK